MPTIAEHSLDKEFVDLLMNKDYKAAYQMLAAICKYGKSGIRWPPRSHAAWCY